MPAPAPSPGRSANRICAPSYLKDLPLFGCTFQEDEVFANLTRYIEAGEIRPVVARTYPLARIAQAQRDFLSRKHTGKLVLLPPQMTA